MRQCMRVANDSLAGPVGRGGAWQEPVAKQEGPCALEGRTDRSTRWGTRWPSAYIILLSFGWVLGVGAVDYLTGSEVSVSLLYLLPVACSAWYAGRTAGLLLAGVSALVWLGSDLLGRKALGQPLVPIWNAAMLAASFGVVAVLLTALRRQQESLEATVMQRTATLRTEVAERRQAEEQLRQTNAELTATRDRLQLALDDLRASHEELQRTQLQLIEAAKSESIIRLAAGVAHEVKNPLMTLSMGADYFLHRGPANDDEAGLLRDMKEAVQRASSIINLMLDFSRPRPLQLRHEDLNVIVEDSLRLVRHQLLQRQVKVVRQLQPDLPLVRLDRNRIEQALVNLFVNAAQAMFDRGILTVRTAARRAKGPDGDPPDIVTVEVEDTGPGIPPQHLAKVFDPFFTTKPPGQGTGLGLAIVQKIMQIHGGSITLGNRLEGGARATLTFKLEPETPPCPKNAS